MSQKIKIMLLLCFTLSLGFIVTSTVSYFVARKSMVEQITNNALPLTGNNIYSEIQRDLLKPIIISSFMANDTFLKDWITSGERDPDKIQRYLKKVKESYNAVTSYFISDETLNYYHPTGIIRHISAENPADSWYFRTKGLKGTHEVNVDFDPSSISELTVFINYKVFDNQGKFMGVTGIGLSISAVTNLIEDYQTRYQRDIYFVDKQGEVTLHGSDFNPQASFKNSLSFPDFKSQILNESTASIDYKINNKHVFLNSRFVSEFNWYLIVEHREGRLDSELFNSLLLNLLISLIITSIVLTFAWLILSNYQNKLEHMATTDKLTGLHNRQLLDSMLVQLFNLSNRTGSPLSAIIFDIDNFKLINDQYGHPFGDKVLVAVAQMLQKLTRESDLLCRWGGEEFIALLSESDADQALSFAEKIQRAFNEHTFTIENQSISIQLSIGVSTSDIADKAEKLIYRADQALLHAKNTGRNKIVSADNFNVTPTDTSHKR